MPTPALVVLTSTAWFGAARVPRALAKAGFEVTLLTPRNALAEKSAYLARVAYLPDAATTKQWVDAFAATVRATNPRLVVPCDDIAFRLLDLLVRSPPEHVHPALHLELATLIVDSLGEPDHYPTSVDKTLLPPAAESLGIRMPPYTIVNTLGEVERFAQAHGYPLVLKRRHSSAGTGVAIVDREADAGRAFASMSHGGESDLGRPDAPQLLAQGHISGRAKYYQVSAWKGKLLAGFAGEKVAGFDDVKAPATVNRYHRSNEFRDVAQRLVRGFGMTGFFALEGLVESSSGKLYLLEINRRLVGGAHRGGAFNVDHWQALHAALHDKPSPSRTDLDDGEEHLTVHFPQEWLHDPNSAWLQTHPVDVPWDEPELIEAMLAMRPK